MSIRSLHDAQPTATEADATVGDNQARLALVDKFTVRQMAQLGDCVETCGGTEDGGLKAAVSRLLDADNKPFVKMLDMLLAQFGMIGDPAAKDALFASVAAGEKRKAADDDKTGDGAPAPKKPDVTVKVELGIKKGVKQEPGKADPTQLENDRYKLEVVTSATKLAGIPLDRATGGDEGTVDEVDLLLKGSCKQDAKTVVGLVISCDDSGSMAGEGSAMVCNAIRQIKEKVRGCLVDGKLTEVWLGLTMWGSHGMFYTLMDKMIKITGDLTEEEETNIDKQIADAVTRLSGRSGRGGNCGQTDFSEGISHAAKYLAANDAPGKEGFDMTHVVMISDGLANQGVTSPDRIGEHVATVRRDYGIDAVHTMPLTEQNSPEFCRKLAEEGGNGLVSFAPKAASLAEAIWKLARTIVTSVGTLIVNGVFHAFLTPDRDHALVKIGVPRGHVGTNVIKVLRVNMLRGMDSFLVRVNVDFVDEDAVPAFAMPAKLKDAIDMEAANAEFKSKMAAAKTTFKGDVRRMASVTRSVQRDLATRGFSAMATSQIDRAATQFEDMSSQAEYRSLAASGEDMVENMVSRGMSAS